MRILLIAHPVVTKPVEYYNLPMGLLYVAAEMRKRGNEVTILNLNEYTQEHYARLIKYHVEDCDIVMLSSLSVFYNIVKDIVRMIKEYRDVPIVLGGGLVTSQPEVIAQAIPEADIFVSGEIEAIDALYPGIVLSSKKIDSSILDSTLPAYDLFNMELYLGLQRPSDGHYRCITDRPRDAAVIASRGCPYQCTFCFHPTGLIYRQRSLDSVFAEIEMLKERYAINIISVYDELFAASKQRLVEFCERIRKLNLFWSCQLRVDSVDRDILRMMKDSGCYIISFGIESGSNTTLTGFKKHITVEQINKTLDATKKVGIAVQGNILFGAENETIDTIRESIDWWIRHKEYRFSIIKAIPYPGTSMYKRAVELGKIEPISFLEQGCPPVNCTQIPDDTYEHVVASEISRALSFDKGVTPITNVTYSQESDSYGRVRVNFETACPHCGYRELRINYALDHCTGMYPCKKCFMRYSVIQ